MINWWSTWNMAKKWRHYCLKIEQMKSMFCVSNKMSMILRHFAGHHSVQIKMLQICHKFFSLNSKGTLILVIASNYFFSKKARYFRISGNVINKTIHEYLLSVFFMDWNSTLSLSHVLPNKCVNESELFK